jgi:integrase/recombinase XerD
MSVSLAWLDITLLAGQLAPAAIVGYTRDLTAYLQFCAEGEGPSPLQASSLARWRTHLAQETRLAAATINRRVSVIKRLVREAAVQGYVDPATAGAFTQIRGVMPRAMKDRMKIPLRITPAQMRLLCDAPERRTLRGRRDRALLHTLATSGCRVSEVCTLTSAQVQAWDRSYVVSVLGKNQTRPRLAPLSPEAYMLLEAWMAHRTVESPYIFTRFAGRGPRVTGAPMSATAVWQLVQHYASHVGLQHVAPHDFRRFVATELTKRYGIRTAQRVLGHARIETTARYLTDDFDSGLTDGLF